MFGNLLLGLIAGIVNRTNIKHLVWSELCPLCASNAARSAAFLYHILHILFVGSYKQVVRVYAVANVAMMAYLHFFRNWSSIYGPRNPVGPELNALNIHATITERLIGARPNPAGAYVWNVFRDWSVFINSRPEPVDVALFDNHCGNMGLIDLSAQ